MTCSEFIEGFSEFYDGTGDPAVMQDAEDHLGSCGSCRRYHDVFDRGRALLRSFPEIDVTDDFHPRLQHRIYHIEDENALGGGRSGSATTAATAVGMALLLVAAAWAPSLWNAPEVALAPIVVSKPEARPLGLRMPPVSVLSASDMVRELEGSRGNLWKHSNTLLFQHSRLNGQMGGGAVVQRAGLD